VLWFSPGMALRVAVISSVNCTGAYLYFYMQYFPTPEWLPLVASLLWAQVHGEQKMILLPFLNDVYYT
jgi:hypothetical protein